jgi:hypothetical protein
MPAGARPRILMLQLTKLPACYHPLRPLISSSRPPQRGQFVPSSLASKAMATRPGKVAPELRSPDAPNGDTPLRIPLGNKEAALQLGARYRTGGWYAPAGGDLDAFRER